MRHNILTWKPKQEKPQSLFVIDNFYNIFNTNWLGCTNTLFYQHPLVGSTNSLFFYQHQLTGKHQLPLQAQTCLCCLGSTNFLQAPTYPCSSFPPYYDILHLFFSIGLFSSVLLFSDLLFMALTVTLYYNFNWKPQRHNKTERDISNLVFYSYFILSSSCLLIEWHVSSFNRHVFSHHISSPDNSLFVNNLNLTLTQLLDLFQEADNLIQIAVNIVVTLNLLWLLRGYLVVTIQSFSKSDRRL